MLINRGVGVIDEEKETFTVWNATDYYVQCVSVLYL